jgi:hypothetical protein
MRPNTRHWILKSACGLALTLFFPILHATTIQLTGNPTFAYDGILVGPYAATLGDDPAALVFCMDLHIDTYLRTTYEGSLSAPQTQLEQEAAFLASYALYLGAPSGGLVNLVEGPISMAIWQIMGTMGATPLDPAAQSYIELAHSAYSNNAITPAFLTGVSIWTPNQQGSAQRFVTANSDDSTILGALGGTQSAGLSEAPEPGTLVLFGTGILLMAVSRIRRSHLVPATRAGALAIGHRSRI